jgi:hypothetical protein
MADLTYRLILRATFEGREQLSQAVQELDKLQFQGSKVGVSVEQGSREAGTGLQSIARSTMSVGFMFNMLESAWMRQTMASIMAANAQDRYNSAVARYGAHSQEAQQAARQLAQEMQYLDAANMRANVSMGLMAGSFLLSTGLLKEETWATIGLTASKYAHIIATKLETAATGEGVIAMAIHSAATVAHTAVLWLKNAALEAMVVLEAMASHGLLVPAIIGAGAVTGAVISQYMKPPPSKQLGGYISETGVYTLHAGEYVLPKASLEGGSSSSIFNIPVNMQVETDLESALRKLNAKITSEWKRMRP